MERKNFTYKNIVSELNNLFCDLKNTIKYDVEKIHNIKVRNRETSYINALLYKFKYSIPDTTKQEIVSEMNNQLNKTTNKNSYDYRERQIPICFYKGMFAKVANLYKKLMLIDDNEFKEIATDGVFNNTNILNKKDNLETTLNLGYYDITNDIPIDITFEGDKKKKFELDILKTYLNDNNINNNCVLILDRLYCSYDIVNYLLKNNYKFVIRFRNNCKNYDKITKNNEIRILTYYDEHNNNITYEKYDNYINHKKNKKCKNVKVNKKLLEENNNKNKFKSVDITMKYEYNLVTNLNVYTYTDNQIKNLYKERW